MDLSVPRAIPIWGSVRDAIAIVWAERRAVALPLALLFVVQVLIFKAAPVPQASPTMVSPAFFWRLGVGFTALLLMALLLTSFNVGLQRRVQLGEDRRGLQLFAFGAPLWRAIGATLLIGAVAMLISFCVALPLALLSERLAQPAKTLFWLIAAPLFLLLMLRTVTRLLLTVPAAVVGLPDRTSRVWDATKRAWWRLLGIALIYVGIGIVLQIPAFILGGIDALRSSSGTAEAGWATLAYSAAFQLFASVCPAMSWVLCYRALFGDAAQVDAAREEIASS